MYIRELRLTHPFFKTSRVELTESGQKLVNYNPFDYVSTEQSIIKLVDGDHAIVVSGPISEDTYVKFKAALKPQTEVVIIASPGGELEPSAKIANLVATRQMATLVPKRAMCYSACTMIFQAGIYRMAYSDSMFMYHSAKFVNEKTGEEKPDQAATAVYWAYLMLYGIDDRLLLRTNDMAIDYFVPAPLAAKYGIVNEIIPVDIPSKDVYIN